MMDEHFFKEIQACCEEYLNVGNDLLCIARRAGAILSYYVYELDAYSEHKMKLNKTIAKVIRDVTPNTDEYKKIAAVDEDMKNCHYFSLILWDWNDPCNPTERTEATFNSFMEALSYLYFNILGNKYLSVTVEHEIFLLQWYINEGFQYGTILLVME